MKSISTPDKVVSKFGELKFKDGMPDAATTQKLYDELDYHHALNAYMNGLAAVNQLALRKGFANAGIKDNEVLVIVGIHGFQIACFSPLMPILIISGLTSISARDLSWLKPAPGTLGIFDDMWWKWISDFGLAGPDRGEGGKYLLLPPGYKGALPEGGYYVCRSNTWQSPF